MRAHDSSKAHKSRVLTKSLPLLLSGLVLSSPAFAGNPFGLKKKIRTKQTAKLKGRTPARARKAAIRKAQTLVLRKLVHEKLSVLRNEPGFRGLRAQPIAFEKSALEAIERAPQRYISHLKLLSETTDKDELLIDLEMELNTSALLKDMSLLDRKIAQARFPKLMFIVEESYTGQDKKTVDISEPTLLGLLEDAFLARGFDLVSAAQIAQLKQQDAAMFQSLLDKPSPAAIRFATSYGAEYIVRATARVVHTSYNAMNLQAHRGHVELSLSAVDASTGAVIESRKLSGNSPPNCYSESCLRVKAVQLVGPRLVQPFVFRIIQYWDKDTENGIRYTVRLYNIKSKKRQGLRFVELLGKLRDVKLVKQLTYAQGRMELEVFYGALLDITHLEAEVLKASEEVRPLQSMDVDSSRGRELNFKL